MDGSSNALTFLVVVGGLVVSLLTAVFLARRARAARQRQFERMERPDQAHLASDRKQALLRDLEAESEPEREQPESESVPRAEASPFPEAKGTEAIGGSAEKEAGPVPPVPSTVPSASEPVAPSALHVPSEPVAPSSPPIKQPTQESALDPTLARKPSVPQPMGVELREARPTHSAIPIARPGERVTVPLAATPEKDNKRRDNQAAFERGLARTRSSWVNKLGKLFSGKKEIDPNLLQEIERVLLTADIGIKTATRLIDELRESLSKKELSDTDAVWDFLRARTIRMLDMQTPELDLTAARPFVLLVVGVNGSGKTTTIGKLAARLRADGKTVVLAAGDTFRAAAVEQLEVWASRTGSLVVKGKEGADPSSVIFESIKRAQENDVDVVIADTAGRLHTKIDLMNELQKVRRVIGKAMPGAPHETWLVLDSTSGQNAIAQAQIFTQAMQVSGIVLTKLDGTAKGGVILGIADELRIPVRFVGVGEGIEDLRAFDAQDFVAAMFQREDEMNTGAAA